MCLGVPGKVIEIEENPPGMTMGTVSFGGIKKSVCLAYVPEVKVGDYVIVHVGFAISRVDEEEALKTFEYLRELEELQDLNVRQSDEEPIRTTGVGPLGKALP